MSWMPVLSANQQHQRTEGTELKKNDFKIISVYTTLKDIEANEAVQHIVSCQ